MLTVSSYLSRITAFQGYIWQRRIGILIRSSEDSQSKQSKLLRNIRRIEMDKQKKTFSRTKTLKGQQTQSKYNERS